MKGPDLVPAAVIAALGVMCLMKGEYAWCSVLGALGLLMALLTFHDY